jgi:hypothetical protein
MIKAWAMNHVIINKHYKPSASMFILFFPFLKLILTRMESFRALKVSNQESFRALKFSYWVLDFTVRKFSNLETFRALKLSNLATGSIWLFLISVFIFATWKSDEYALTGHLLIVNIMLMDKHNENKK